MAYYVKINKKLKDLTNCEGRDIFMENSITFNALPGAVIKAIQQFSYTSNIEVIRVEKGYSAILYVINVKYKSQNAFYVVTYNDKPIVDSIQAYREEIGNENTRFQAVQNIRKILLFIKELIVKYKIDGVKSTIHFNDSRVLEVSQVIGELEKIVE